MSRMLINILLIWLITCTGDIDAELRDSYWIKAKNISSIALEQTFMQDFKETLSCILKCNEMDTCNAVVIDTDLETCTGYLIAIKTNLNTKTITNSMDLYCQNEICDGFGYTCSKSLDFCYKLHTEPSTWMEAKQACENESATLIILQTMPKYQLLIELSSEISGNLIWVGANDLQTEGSWVWLNGQALTLTSSFWMLGDPNDPGNEDCIGFISTGLVDAPCSWQSYFVCQK